MPLSLPEARDRAAFIDVHSYDVVIDLTDRQSFGSQTTVSFSFTRPRFSTFLELADARDVAVEGVSWEYAEGRVHLHDLAAENVVTVRCRLPYSTDGEGMHTFTDPVDGAVYVSALTSLDVAQRVFACFDQPDLKARVSLRVRVPKGWIVVANGALGSVVSGDDDDLWTFATTPPIAPYLFTLCAGRWVSREWEHAGTHFGWHARASQAEALDRDLEELRSVTERCFDHMTELFDEPYPFDSYDQVLVPGLNWSAMEFPGCVVFRDEMLPPQHPRQTERRYRAATLSHEMAHMWFGDLATMRWWEDTWLNESFADYLGSRVAEEAAGFGGLSVDLITGDLPTAFTADARRSTHPVAVPSEDVPDVDTCRGNFDALTYAKGAALLRQLVVWLGDEAFLAGSNAYLSRHAWSNASLADFVDCLASVTDRDVRSWVDAWLRTTGFDTLRVERSGEAVVVVRDGVRPHRCSVAVFDEDWRLLDRTLVDLADEPVPVRSGAYVVPNAGAETFAAIALDDETTAALGEGLRSILDAQTRAVLWVHVAEQVRVGRMSPLAAFDLMAAALPEERTVSIVHDLLAWACFRPLTWWTPAARVQEAEKALAGVCEAGLAGTTDPEAGGEFARALARTTTDPALLERWLEDGYADGPAGRVRVGTDLRWDALTRLARLDAIGRDRIEAERAADGTQDGVVGAIRAAAALPSKEAKAEAWRIVTDPASSNRALEAAAEGLWDRRRLEAMAPWVERYLHEAPALAARTPTAAELIGDAFPALPLTEEQVAAFERALQDDLPTVLRRTWSDRLDDVRFPLG